MTMQPGLVLDPGTFWLRRATHGEALAPSSGAPYCAGANDSAASACTIGVLTRNQMA